MKLTFFINATCTQNQVSEKNLKLRQDTYHVNAAETGKVVQSKGLMKESWNVTE